MTTGEAPTAKDKVAAMLKERVAPELRTMGFKGSGQNYHLPVPDHFALLGFQKARFGTRHDVMFTINLLACSHADWAALAETKPYYGERPIVGAMYPAPVWGSGSASSCPSRATTGGTSSTTPTPTRWPTR